MARGRERPRARHAAGRPTLVGGGNDLVLVIVAIATMGGLHALWEWRQAAAVGVSVGLAGFVGWGVVLVVRPRRSGTIGRTIRGLAVMCALGVAALLMIGAPSLLGETVFGR
jgi:hypothetical protein